jgi:hypothetical protein
MYPRWGSTPVSVHALDFVHFIWAPLAADSHQDFVTTIELLWNFSLG